MAIEVDLHLRGLREPQRVTFEDGEDWELRDTERLVLLLDGDRVVRAAVAHTEFLFARVHADPTADPDGDGG